MAQIIFTENEVYHIFNRGLDRRPIFLTRWDFRRARKTLDFYRFKNSSLSLGKALVLKKQEREKFFLDLEKEEKKQVEIISYCFMPNHFHFLLKQLKERGVSKLLSDFANSYTRYFNARHKRLGPLFEGVFKAVRIEKEEQLMHVSRYIHLNPVASLVVKEEKLSNYTWSSLPEYLDEHPNTEICDKEIILNSFSSKDNYRKFIYNQIKYAQNLETIKHLLLEEKQV